MLTEPSRYRNEPNVKYLNFFLAHTVLKNSADLTAVDYLKRENLLSREDNFVSDDTSALLIHTTENEGGAAGKFYEHVIQFYQAFIKKQLKIFDFKSPVFRTLSLLYPVNAQSMSLSTFDMLDKSFSVNYDKRQIKLEYRDFSTDATAASAGTEDAVDYWC